MVVAEASAATLATASHAGPLVLHQLPRLDAADTPTLSGVAATAAKPQAEVLLITASGDPLLCWWRFGAGIALAYPAQFAVRDLPAGGLPERQARFWGRVVRQALPRPAGGSLDVRLSRSADRARLSADALAPSGEYRSDAAPMVRVTTPGGPRPEQPLPLVAPGRYGADFALAGVGDYEFEIRPAGAESGNVERRALVIDYPDELRPGLDDPTRGAELLREVARLSGGQFDPTPEAVMSAAQSPASRLQPLWPYFLLAGGAVLLIEALCRRRSGSLA